MAKVRSVTRLSVLREEFDPEAEKTISHGWPAILAVLKTLLETGEPLPGSDEP